MTPPQAPQGFVTIGPGIYISLSRITSAPPLPLNDSAPNVILILGWMGALTRHLQNYLRKYSELYPYATQIVIKCAPSFLYTSERALRNRLLPVVEALEALGCLSSINNSTQESTHLHPRVLVHSFSNGGGFQLTSLGHLLSSRYPSILPSQHLVSALILDSAPTIGSFRSLHMAFNIAIRNPAARYIALAFIYILHAFRLSLNMVFGGEMLGTRYLRDLHNPRLLPWMDLQTPRLYVFSKKDELLPWQMIQEHADAAKILGLNVRCEVYEDSAHVAHMRHDPKRYWASIQDFWQVACCESRAKLIEATS